MTLGIECCPYLDMLMGAGSKPVRPARWPASEHFDGLTVIHGYLCIRRCRLFVGSVYLRRIEGGVDDRWSPGTFTAGQAGHLAHDPLWMKSSTVLDV